MTFVPAVYNGTRLVTNSADTTGHISDTDGQLPCMFCFAHFREMTMRPIGSARAHMAEPSLI